MAYDTARDKHLQGICFMCKERKSPIGFACAYCTVKTIQETRKIHPEAFHTSGSLPPEVEEAVSLITHVD